MATIEVNNNSTLNVGEQLIYKLWLDISNNKISSDSEHVLFLSKAINYEETLRTLIAGLDSGEADTPGTTFSTKTDTQIKVRSTDAFDDDIKDRDITADFKGINLLKKDSSTSLTSFGVTYDSIEYSGANHIPTNVIGIDKGTSLWKVSYKPYLPSSSSVTDRQITVTSDSGQDTSISYYKNGGTTITYNNPNKYTLLGSINTTEDGKVNGKINSYIESGTSDDSTGVKQQDNFTFKSSSGFNFNEHNIFTGDVDNLIINHTYQYNNTQISIKYSDKSINTVLSSALTDFIAGANTTNEIAAALLYGNDKITAKGDNTTINGYLGNDSITLSNGYDTIEFSTALGAANIDSIKGFKSGTDHLKLSSTIFAGYQGANNFITGTTPLDTNDHIIYDKNSGKLYYDADGSGTTFGLIQFATLTGKPTITASDIYTF